MNTTGADSPLTRRIHDQIIELRAESENARVVGLSSHLRLEEDPVFELATS
jgi:hypothetical protein